MAFNPIEEEKLNVFLGPPPKLVYMKEYGIDEATAFCAAQKHREYGKTKAIYEAQSYPGIQEVLEELKKIGYSLAVSTLKSQNIAEDILEKFGLFSYFDAIVGMNQEETFNKADTIKMAIQKTNSIGRVIMIGDSMIDYDGSIKAEVDFIGVLYGFGFSDLEKYSFKTAPSPYDIVNCIQEMEMQDGMK